MRPFEKCLPTKQESDQPGERLMIKLTNYCYNTSPIRYLYYLHVLTNNNNKKLITIAIDEANYQALRNLGHTGESFNTVINRLINSTKALDSQNVKNDGGNGR